MKLKVYLVIDKNTKIIHAGFWHKEDAEHYIKDSTNLIIKPVEVI